MPTSFKSPEKQTLVDKKRELNKAISRSVDKLFSAKDAWNGKPAPEIGVQMQHSIMDPIPNEAIKALDEVIQVLNNSSGILKDIAREQGSQSKRRDEIKSRKLDLSSIASTPVSRFVSHVTAPFQTDNNKWTRLKLLRTSTTVRKHLEDLNSLILSNTNESIPEAVYQAKDLYYIIENELFERVVGESKSLPKKIPEPNVHEMQERTTDSGHPYEQIEIQYGLQSIRDELLTIRRSPQLMRIRAVDPVKYKDIDQKLKDLSKKREYIQALLKINYKQAELEHRQLIQEMQSIKDMFFESNVSEDIEKEANVVSRFLKRKNLEYFTFPSNHQKSIRLKADTSIQKAYEAINELMNALEKPYIDTKSLGNNLAQILLYTKSAYETLADLAEIYNSWARVSKHKSRSKKERAPADIITNTDITSLRRMALSFEQMRARLSND